MLICGVRECFTHRGQCGGDDGVAHHAKAGDRQEYGAHGEWRIKVQGRRTAGGRCGDW